MAGIIKNSFFSGTTSGLGLAAFLWIAEEVTGYRIFILLLNVDFIPIIGTVLWPVAIELLFHLIISWVITFIYSLLIKKRRRSNVWQWAAVFFLSAGAGLSYFPLSIMAIRPVPSVADEGAILLWFAGHLLYAVILKKSSTFLFEQNKKTG